MVTWVWVLLIILGVILILGLIRVLSNGRNNYDGFFDLLSDLLFLDFMGDMFSGIGDSFDGFGDGIDFD